jgi:[CysO sulfur-carrier protein]-S-L-cysteine hydrolase
LPLRESPLASGGWPILSIPFRLLIPRNHYDAMVAQAQTELPNECCGLLAGLVMETALPSCSSSRVKVGNVLQRYPLVNNAASPREYLANDRTLFEAYRDMRNRGLDLLAVYHSHPASDPVPSKTDLARNYFEQIVHLIISLTADEPVVRAWWLGQQDYREADWGVLEPDKA